MLAVCYVVLRDAKSTNEMTVENFCTCISFEAINRYYILIGANMRIRIALFSASDFTHSFRIYLYLTNHVG